MLFAPEAMPKIIADARITVRMRRGVLRISLAADAQLRAQRAVTDQLK
jgi:hypothetical protein